jgi:hypothetical protein
MHSIRLFVFVIGLGSIAACGTPSGNDGDASSQGDSAASDATSVGDAASGDSGSSSDAAASSGALAMRCATFCMTYNNAGCIGECPCNAATISASCEAVANAWLDCVDMHGSAICAGGGGSCYSQRMAFEACH